ncbi:MAG: CPBP family intramembrane glutamic endopeptidase [Spirochaetia bacterium]
MPEELGWRGYVPDALRPRINLLQASLLLGMIWTVRHLPFVFVQVSFQQELLAHPGAFITYFAAFCRRGGEEGAGHVQPERVPSDHRAPRLYCRQVIQTGLLQAIPGRLRGSWMIRA